MSIPQSTIASVDGTGALAEFGDWLRGQLGARTQGQMAEYVGVSSSTVSRWLQGKSAPEPRNIRKLAAYLKVDREEVERRLPDDEMAATAIPPAFLSAFADQLAARISDEVADRVIERLTTGAGSEEMETVLQRAGVGDAGTLDDRIPVLFSGVIWEELTDAEKAGVIALAKRLMGRSQGKMGRRRPA